MSREVTIVNYYGAQNDSQCFYCPNPSAKYGMWAYRMAAADYQDLIDRGWRRLGQYMQKPNNSETCCPSFTIRCDASQFSFTKSHKKIMKNFNNFLRNGQKTNGVSSYGSKERFDDEDANSLKDSAIGSDSNNSSDQEFDESETKSNSEQNLKENETSASEEIKLITSTPKVPIDIENVIKLIEIDDRNDSFDENKNAIEIVDAIEVNASDIQLDDVDIEKAVKELTTENDEDKAESSKSQLKAKFLRQQRKAQKQMARAESFDATAPPKSYIKNQKAPKNREKTLESFIKETPTDGVHRLRLNLISIDSEEFEGSKKAEFDLYKRYQTKIHNDPPIDCDEFNNFICKSPIHHEKPENGPKYGYGTFHQQYWVDDTLIAVGVMDILPGGISSVYFFYDPDLTFLTLGIYGILREVEFIQEMNKTCPDIRGYYIGFYIPTVPKMLYKGKIHPSYLLCPETYSWHLLSDDLLKTLQQSKNARFNLDVTTKSVGEFNYDTDLNHMRFLVDSKLCFGYNDYKNYKGADEGNDEDINAILEYGKLMGKILSRRLYLVI